MVDNLQQPIKEITRIFRKHHLSYDQTRHVFKEARKLAELKPPKRNGKGTVTRLSKDELELFLQQSYKQSPKTGLMMQTLYETAMRVSEFTNMQPDHIYQSDEVIVVPMGKGGKRREVPVDQSLIRALQLHLDGRRIGYVFESRQHRRFSERRIEQITKEIGDEAGISIKVHPHLLRHTRATLLAEAGMSKDLLQVMLGHESPETTEIYTHTAARDVRKEFRKIHDLEGYEK